MEGRKNKMVKAVFFDIDGTLLDHGRGGVMPDSTKRSLHVLRDKGVKLFVATGRPRVMLSHIEQLFPFDGWVTLNGQYCYCGNTVRFDFKIESFCKHGESRFA